MLKEPINQFNDENQLYEQTKPFYCEPKIVKTLIRARNEVRNHNADRFYVVDGREGCLSGDSQIQISRCKLSRRYSIKKLYNHYNGNPDKINQKQHPFDLTKPSFVRSYNGKEIRLNKIKDVVYSGKKETFSLILDDNKQIRATSEHKFLTREGWEELKNLSVGMEVMCDTLHAGKGGRRRIKLYDVALRVYYHPAAKRIAVHRLIYEARMNDLDFIEYLDILLNEEDKSKQLKFIDDKIYHIHHKDGNHYNNSIDNLQLMIREEHLRCHGNSYYANFSQGIPIYTKIKAIIPYGVEDVYDIQCEDPNHNFVANGIVVHNSGKSTEAQQLAYILDPTICLDRITFTAKQFEEAISKGKKGDAIIYDEAFNGLSAKSAMSKENRRLITILQQCRQKNLFLFIVLPSIFLLEKYPALFRSSALFHVIKSPTNFNKRLVKVYGYKEKRELYLRGKPLMSYDRPYIRFSSRFFNKFPPTINEDDYIKKKAKAFEKMMILEEEEDESRVSLQRSAMVKLAHDRGISYADMSKYMESLGIPFKKTAIGQVVHRFKDKLKSGIT